MMLFNARASHIKNGMDQHDAIHPPSDPTARNGLGALNAPVEIVDEATMRWNRPEFDRGGTQLVGEAR
jgi:hypothetical protein